MSEKEPFDFKSLIPSAEKAETDYLSFVSESDIEFDAVAGDNIVGTLSDDEKTEFLRVLGIETALEEMQEEVISRLNLKAAHGILDAQGRIPKDLFGDTIGNEVAAEFGEQYFFLVSLLDLKRAEFWFNLRKRLQIFASFVEIRAGYTVVSLGRKTDRPKAARKSK